MKAKDFSELMSTDPNCIFCKIIKGQIPCKKIYETEKSLAFMDINPLSDGHCLVIPKYHCEKLHELPPEEMIDVGPTLVKIAKAIGASDYNLLQNNGAKAHQLVKHVHFHLIPKPDALQGLGIVWKSEKADDSKLDVIVKNMKEQLNTN
eukprot:TRINITY_DN2079_c0_g1_i1.p1 TRINITY_DN2079_c0_g1~~TRINITY_DN2079_c0_g1_i1.p1  ORF type:complete len:149 (-),score=16.08 TRINITY_DN2079_c0_g1_i1:31-477(-)